MNARERADKILNYINGEFGVNPSVTGDQSNLEFISAAIEEAERDAVKKIGLEVKFMKYGESTPWVKEAFSEGYSAAREQALEIYRHSGTSEEVESRLKAMKPDGEGA